MSDTCTYLVNTSISRQDAPDAARALYRHLVEAGAIGPRFHSSIPFGIGPAFTPDVPFPIFEEAVEPLYRPSITGVDVEVTAHEWRNTEGGWAELVSASSPGAWFFYNFGDIELTCPQCGASMMYGDPGAESVDQSFEDWGLHGNEDASIHCPACQERSPIRQWRSDHHWFAAGHLAIKFWHGCIMSLVENPQPPAATALRRFVGDLNNDYAVVFCRI
jgi:hypothetical protein